MWNVLENIVYIMGLRKWYNIFVGKLMDKEIDFVFEKNWKRLYIQVCYLLIDEKVIVREFWNLEKIADNWEKYVVSMDILDFGVRNGIKHIKVWELNNRL
jgi:predicted AAA+ superfamily ATPase